MSVEVECPKCGTKIEKYNVVTASFLGLAPCPKCKKHVKYIWPEKVRRTIND
jgi:uncharacterized protein (UPF0212 family)